MTSSPSPMPNARMQRCRPAVPELTATAWGAETYSATADSNCSVTGPRLSRGVRNTATTASISASVMSGADNGIFISRHPGHV